MINLKLGVSRTCAFVVITLHVLLACPILLMTFSLGIERYYQIGNLFKGHLYHYLIRLITLIRVCCVSILVPYFSDLMGLLGSVANMMLIFIFPVIFYLKLKSTSIQQKCILIGILCIGILAGAVGGYDAIVALYKDMHS